MNTLLSTILSVTILSGYPQDNSISKDLYYSYLPIVDQATNNCRGAKPENVDVQLLWDLVKIEAKYNPPEELKGMLLAAALIVTGKQL